MRLDAFCVRLDGMGSRGCVNMVRFLGNLQAKDAMKRIEDVAVGGVIVTGEKIVLRSMALGSCIGLTAYDVGAKTGAIAHIMLPGAAPDKTVEKTRYAANAIDCVLDQMGELGSGPADIEVCLVGGGNVLEREDDGICENNMDSVKRILQDKGIAVRASVLGGTQRKSVSIDIETGDVRCREGDAGEKLLWKRGEDSEGQLQ